MSPDDEDADLERETNEADDAATRAVEEYLRAQGVLPKRETA